MIKSFKAIGSVRNQLDIIFNNQVIHEALNEEMWIAGGFAREVCHSHFGLNKNKYKKEISENRIISYLTGKNTYSTGDIDFFCNSKDHYIKVVKKINEAIGDLTMQNHLRAYDSDFAHNYQTYNDNEDNSVCPATKIQFVNKFFFKDIKECFDSFDVTNCKYAIKKVFNEYIIFYDIEALENDSNNLLKLNSSKSPYTISRIIKYLKHRNLDRLSPCKENKKIFMDCLYKSVENNWNPLYNLKEEVYKENIKKLHKLVSFSPETLSMFIGFAKDSVFDKQLSITPSSGYGIYVSNIFKDIDWATNELINTCKE